MMHPVRQGIVLRVHAPYQHKVSVFDQIQGKIYAVAQSHSVALMHGELIAYRLEPWKHMYRLCDIEVLTLPAAWVCEDILFLHHVLEIAFFFIPEQSCATQLFRLCQFLYEKSEQQHVDPTLVKRLFLGKFFALLGVYPDQAFEENEQLFHLFSGSGETLPDGVHNKIQSTDELYKKLQRWLLGCIQTHPHANTFTTMHFLHAHSE